MVFIYRIGLVFYSIVVSIFSLFNEKAKLWLVGRKKIFARIESSLVKKEKLAWFHCASLGEFEQGRPLIEAYKSNYPNHTILLTFFSPSGYEIRKNYDKADYIFYLPLDSPKNAKRFLNITKPDIVFFIKYEFWHFYIDEIGKRKIPLFLVSGIFRKDQRFFKWYGSSFRKMLKNFTCFFLQNESSQSLLKNIGFNNSIITGDTRFDRVFTIAQTTKDLPLIEKFKEQHPVLILGSSWQPDEELVLRYINETNHRLKLIIAPHEVSPENINRIFKGLTPDKTIIKYSEANDATISNTDVLLIDSIGLLSSLYKYGNIAYIGGGFGKGIHNILEAATFGLPVIFGPNHEKFKEATDLLLLGGAKSVSNYLELKVLLDDNFSNPQQMQSNGRISSDYILKNKGATKKISEYISNYINYCS
ncbi:MAG: glycosyltransferase N-terminal domain-containing protein [Bacteroidales bacterium]|jgi:3-deoxy-D-manno-octulosonic-acid transferase|nr:glycosyltransferase N-terminal domain-containing protein [Bacteroidales bacterium]